MFQFNSFTINPGNISLSNSTEISSNCMSFISNQVINPNMNYLMKLLHYSGKGFNQLGDQPACLGLETASYYIGSLMMNQAPTALFMGVCMDSACTAHDLLEILMVNGTGFYQLIDPSEIKYDINWGSILLMSIVGICLLLTIISSFYFKIKHQQNQPKNIKKYLYYFSLQNTLQVFTKSGQIKAINGVRALCFFFVVFGHVISTRIQLATNTPSLKYFTQRFYMTIVFSFTYAVDVFFMLGGFMVGFLFPKLYKRNPSKIKFITAIVQRILRFWPLYIFAILQYWKFAPNFGFGPIFSSYKNVVSSCSKYWWSDLLFIGNFKQTMCIVWAWYIENDMQFFIVSLIFVFIYLHISKKFSYLLQVLTLLLGLIFVFVVYTIKKYKINSNYQDMMQMMTSDFYNIVYIKPWARISPYMLGLIVGILYFNDKELKQQTFISIGLKKKWVRTILPIIGLFLYIFLTCIPYTLSHGVKWPQFFHSLYASATHFLYPLGFLLMILPIIYNYSNPFKSFFQNNFLQFVSKITFCCYMIHYPYLTWRSLSLYATPYLSPSFGLVYGFSQLVIILLFGFIIAIIYQFPIASILDNLTGKKKTKYKQQILLKQ